MEKAKGLIDPNVPFIFTLQWFSQKHYIRFQKFGFYLHCFSNNYDRFRLLWKLHVEIWWRFAAGLNHSLSAHRAVMLAKSSTLNDVCNELVNQWHIWINRRKSVNYKRYFWSLSMQPYAINLLSYWHMSVIEKCHWKVNVGVNSKLSVHPITLTHSYNNTSK